MSIKGRIIARLIHSSFSVRGYSGAPGLTMISWERHYLLEGVGWGDHPFSTPRCVYFRVGVSLLLVKAHVCGFKQI